MNVRVTIKTIGIYYALIVNSIIMLIINIFFLNKISNRILVQKIFNESQPELDSLIHWFIDLIRNYEVN